MSLTFIDENWFFIQAVPKTNKSKATQFEHQ